MKARRAGAKGASLLLTLVVIAGIVILFAILARLVMAERRVSRGYSELQRADMAAQAGTADANNLLLYLFANFPDAATFWDPKISDTDTPGTVYLFQQRPKVSGKQMLNMSNATAPQVYARPLVSGALTKAWASYKDALPAALITDTTKNVDLNAPKTFGGAEPNGWIGAMPGATPSPIKAPWVEILEDPTKAKDMNIDAATGKPKNPAVARYAYWIDDESFKLNVNAAKAQPRGSADAETKVDGDKTYGDAKASLKGFFVREENQTIAEAVAESVAEARDKLKVTGGRLLSPRQVGHATEAPSDTDLANFGRDYKYLVSTVSSGLDLSRSGAKRLDLNKVVDDSLDGASEISYGSGRKGPDLFAGSATTKIPEAIRRIREAIKANAPRFGQRFYRSTNTSWTTNPTVDSLAGDKNSGSVVSTADADLYLLKLATNIYDFISPAVNPTVLDQSGNIVLAVDAEHPVARLDELDFDYDPAGNTNPVAAMGKKALPSLTEYAWSVRTLYSHKFKPKDPVEGAAIYEFVVDHYFEFWNMSKDTVDPAAGDLGPDPYIVLQDQPFITSKDKIPRDTDKNTDDVGEGRDFKIKLTDEFLVNGAAQKLVFPPNEAVVITTDPEWANWTGKNNLHGKKVYVATALYDPTTGEPVDQGVSRRPFPTPFVLPVKVPNVRHYRMNSFDFRSGGDYGEVQIGPDAVGAALSKYFMGNRYGVLDVAVSLPLHKYFPSNVLNVLDNPDGEAAQGVNTDIRSGRPENGEKGYWDPRNKVDALTIGIENVGATGKFSTLNLGGVQLGNLGPFAASEMWDSDKITVVAGNPVAITAARPLRNIGELGQVSDPVLTPNWTATERRQRRPGGRTLAIGQADLYWDGTRSSTVSTAALSYLTSGSREWTAWRLTDIFTARRDADRKGEAKAEVEGLYNPNGILRDGGLVLRALLEGIQFGDAGASDPGLAGRVFSTANTSDGTQGATSGLTQTTTPASGGVAVARYLAQRLSRQFPTRFSPIFEPGEISQLQMFSPYGHSTASTKGQIYGGTDVTAMNDRGREELTRRLTDLITARGNTFSIYVVGQSLDRKGNPTATKAQKITVRLRPVWLDSGGNPASPKDDFNPNNQNEVEARFGLPDHWRLDVLQVENA